MGIEIERKFLVLDDRYKAAATKVEKMEQGYLGKLGRASVRIRRHDDQATLNIKSATLGISRREYEYAVPLHDAQEMLEDLCDGAVIRKTRHHVPVGKHVYEVDEFDGANQGLVVAEIELTHEDEAFEKPDWLGAEVSEDPRYYNVALVAHPFCDWDKTGEDG